MSTNINERFKIKINAGNENVAITAFGKNIYYTPTLNNINVTPLLNKANKEIIHWLSDDKTMVLVSEFKHNTSSTTSDTSLDVYSIIDSEIYINVLLLKCFLDWMISSSSDILDDALIYAKVHSIVSIYQLNYAIVRFREAYHRCHTHILLNSTTLSTGDCKGAIESNTDIVKELVKHDNLCYAVFNYLKDTLSLTSEASGETSDNALSDVDILSIQRIAGDVITDAITLCRDLLILALNTLSFNRIAMNAFSPTHELTEEANKIRELFEEEINKTYKQRLEDLKETLHRTAHLCKLSKDKECANIKMVLQYLSAIS